MSEPPTGTSSRAAKTCKEALMVFDNSSDRLGFGSRIPLVDLERSAKNDPVGPREHVTRSASEGILDLLLWFEDRELAARRVQVLVPEEITAAKTGTIEHEALRKRCDLSGRSETAHQNVPSGKLHIADHLTQVTTRFDIHRVVTQRVRPHKGMLGGAQHPVDRGKGCDGFCVGTTSFDIGG